MPISLPSSSSLLKLPYFGTWKHALVAVAVNERFGQESIYGLSPGTKKVAVVERCSLGTLSKDNDNGSENVAKEMNLRSFKLNRVYLDPVNMSNAGDFSWS